MANPAADLRRSTILPDAVAAQLRRRASELGGVAVLALAVVLLGALFSFNGSDPSINSATGTQPSNLLGAPGAFVADLMLQLFGLSSGLIALVFAGWAWRMVSKQGISLLWLRIVLLLSGLFLASIALSPMPTLEAWPVRAGYGGVTGDILMTQAVAWMKPSWGLAFTVLLVSATGIGAILTLGSAAGLDRREWRAILRGIARASVWTWTTVQTRIAAAASRPRVRVEPTLDGDAIQPDPDLQELDVRGDDEAPPKKKRRRVAPAVVEPKAPKAPAGKRAKDARQGSLDLPVSEQFQLPPLDILEAPPMVKSGDGASKESLAQNAKLLESVLEDFGIQGEITKVRPGPVVTLYELEPAPGTKTSRVVGLSDDIARSMSALSVRIAVVPGRSVIGIEMPNAKRDTVYLRELLAADAYERHGGDLTLVMGKDIGGAPMLVDLARMPHLLIAGTTGSGKSVAINTMILSLLYRKTPDECRFIMIDPKMLELSVYDDIPNLLAPVVTDPAKAVVALKWAVREMEDRYRAMSQMGVRNITGYNGRLAEARKKKEELTRRVQTGFDEAGKPVFEDQPLDMNALPHIVVVVDEMADLMMVAGKDIEGAIQRLAQMARAAGIHLIMATQRPSVDVITGTIKANFPTRVSFQVTSKIDSRTILGEQGAEQLLGQGDMLYMAGGGQITRAHGPFVSDEEVEQVVQHLKNQAEPEYDDTVTEDAEAGFSVDGQAEDSGDELYDEAVAIIAREGKASTSFIQRHLQIGYNRAARIIERMEQQGVVSKADRVGRREVLIGHHE